MNLVLACNSSVPFPPFPFSPDYLKASFSTSFFMGGAADETHTHEVGRDGGGGKKVTPARMEFNKEFA